MLQRTHGRFLLSLLVVTGLAGTTVSYTLTKEERSSAISQLKNTRNEILRSVDGLTENQLNYRFEAGQWSIAECITHIALAERWLWNLLDSNMKTPANPGLRDSIQVKDLEILHMVTDRSQKRTAPEPMDPARANWKNPAEAKLAFKNARNERIKYVRTTTEDLRNHVIQFGPSYIDGYQFILFVNGHSERHLAQIRAILEQPGFPRP